MTRLPIVGGDSGNWGTILNDFLEVSLNADGTIQPGALTTAGAVLSVNTVTPNTNGNVTLTASNVGAPTALSQQSDVNVSSPTNNQVLAYSSSAGKWVNQTPSGGCGAVIYAPPPSGDETGTTDYATISSLLAVGARVVLWPGTYYINQALVMPDACVLQGAAWGYSYTTPAPLASGTVVTQVDTAVSAITASTPQSAAISLFDLVIEGPGSGTGNGIDIPQAGGNQNTYLVAERVMVTSFGGHGWAAENLNFSSLRDCQAAYNGGSGVLISSGPGVALSNVHCYGNSGDGFTLSNCSGQLAMLYTNANGGTGINLISCDGLMLSGSTTEDDATGTVITGSQSVTVAGHYASQNNSYGIHITENSASIAVIGFFETAGTEAINSLHAENGSITFVSGLQVQTAASLPSNYCTQVLQNGITSGKGPLTGGYLALNGIPSDTTSCRFVGGTYGGAPTEGSFDTGDVVVDHTGVFWICTAGGTPGSWASTAPLASPAFTGSPTAPTQSGTDSSTKLATTAFVQDALPSSSSPLAISRGGTGTSSGAPENEVFAGPSSGGAGAPSFRPLTPADLSLDASGIGGLTTAGLGLGLLAVNPAYAASSASGNSEQLSITLCTATASKTVTTLGIMVTQAGVTPGAGVNVLAMYSESGELLAQTGDMTSAFESTGFAEGAIGNPGGITSYALTEGTNYYLAWLSSFTGTIPKFGGVNTGSTGQALNGHYVMRNLTSQTSLPALITPSSMNSYTFCTCMYAG